MLTLSIYYIIYVYMFWDFTFAPSFSVLIKSTMEAGGPERISHLGRDRFNFFNFSPDPTVRHTFWSLIFGAIPQFFYMTITQAGVQRIMSTPDVKSATKLLYIASPIYCLLWALVMLEGLTVFAYFSEKGCDPVASGKIDNPNQIVPYTILEMFHNLHGMPGLFIAALAAASLSTLSSGLSGLSAVLCVDVLQVWKPHIKDQTATNIAKILVVLLGVVSAALAFILSNTKGPLTQIMSGLTGAVAGPETGMFLVSAFFRRSRHRAVFIATLLGLALNLWMNFGQTFSKDLIITPPLPLGPTSQCSSSNETTTTVYVAATENNISSLRLENFVTASDPTILNSTVLYHSSTDSSHQRSGIDVFYSVSYMYFHLIGTIVTVLLAVIGSLLTQPKKKHTVNEECVLSLKVLIPAFVLKLCRPKSLHHNGDEKRKSCETEKMIAVDNKDTSV